MKTRNPAVQGWLNIDPERPRLMGTRCTRCSSVFFPGENTRCRNPSCGAHTLEETELSPSGRLWSYTNAGYKPPPPFVPRTDPFKPFLIAAVELDAEKMVVLGQVVDGVDLVTLKVGMPMELALDTLLEDDATKTIVWKWKPVSSTEGAR